MKNKAVVPTKVGIQTSKEKGNNVAESKRFELKLREQNIPDEDLLNDLKRVALFLKKDSVSAPTYESYGNYNSRTISRRFGSWNQALEKAGLGISFEMELTDERLFFNLLKVWESLGRQPVRRDLCPPSSFGWRRYTNRFGTWNNALKQFVKWANSTEDETGTGERLLDISSKHDILNGLPSDQNLVERNIHRTSRSIGHKLRFRILRRDNFKCVICGRNPATDPTVELVVDHIVAWSKNGETVYENLQTLCRPCNSGKGNLEMQDNAEHINNSLSSGSPPSRE